LAKTASILSKKKEKLENSDTVVSVKSTELTQVDERKQYHTQVLEKEMNKKAQCETDLIRLQEALPASQSKLAGVTADIQVVSAAAEQVQDELRDCEFELEELQRSYDQAQKRLKLLHSHDPAASYLKELQRYPLWASEVAGMRYVQEHKDEFEQEVYGPIGRFLTIQDPHVAALVNSELRQEVNAFIVRARGRGPWGRPGLVAGHAALPPAVLKHAWPCCPQREDHI
jgi:chromosome segregation ATPase